MPIFFPKDCGPRFHMERLRSEVALLAIKEPLKYTGRSFAEGVAEKLVEDLLKIRVMKQHQARLLK